MKVDITTIEQAEQDAFSGTKSGVVFSGFPMHREDYVSDVQEIMAETIKSFGIEEWRLITLTSEFHRHLGIYAILGAKMGLFAREVLGAGHDELQIVSLDRLLNTGRRSVNSDWMSGTTITGRKYS